MDSPTNRLVDYVLYLLLFFGITYILFLNPSKSRPLLTSQTSQCPTSKTYKMATYRDELEEALSESSTENKTLIISIVNKAYVEGDKPMLDLFLDGFWLGEDTRTLINHLLIVAMDQISYERCKFLRLHCYKLETDGVDYVGEKLYMSDDFIKMMWRRTLFLRDVLNHGYNFIFTFGNGGKGQDSNPGLHPDTDVLWLRNPFHHLSLDQSVDLQISTDKFNGNQWSEANPINTGFYMINSNNKTIALFDSWYASKDHSPGLKEQDVLVRLMHQRLFRKLRLKVRFLDTVYFSGFCHDSRDVRAVTTVHANCCRSISAKLSDLTVVIHDWKRYKGSSDYNQTLAFRWSNHTACISSWRH